MNGFGTRLQSAVSCAGGAQGRYQSILQKRGRWSCLKTGPVGKTPVFSRSSRRCEMNLYMFLLVAAPLRVLSGYQPKPQITRSLRTISALKITNTVGMRLEEVITPARRSPQMLLMHGTIAFWLVVANLKIFSCGMPRAFVTAKDEDRETARRCSVAAAVRKASTKLPGSSQRHTGPGFYFAGPCPPSPQPLGLLSPPPPQTASGIN